MLTTDKKNKIKTIYFDLDGTLFNEHKSLSLESAAALKVLKANDIKFSVATGRHFLMIKRELENFNDNDLPFVTMNGSVIVHQGKIIYEKTIDLDITKKIVEILNSQNIGYYIYTDKSVYVSNDFPYHLKNLKINETLKDEWKYPFTRIDNQEKLFTNLENEKIYKFLIIKEEYGLVDELLNSCLAGKYTYIKSQANTHDIFNNEASKGNALQFLHENSYINLDQCMVFGDNQNDIEMFEVSAYAVAMGNATPDLIKVADEIIESNVNNGVAKYVNQHWKHL